MFHYQLFYSVQLAFLVLGSFFDGGFFQKGSVSGSGNGPGDPGSRGPAMPDPETFPYEWLGVRQYIYMPCFMSVIGKQIESLKEIHKINKNYFIFIRLSPS